jgi:thiol peroxidase
MAPVAKMKKSAKKVAKPAARAAKPRERKGAVTMHGKPLTLVGREVKVNEKAPDFKALNMDLSQFDFQAQCRGKVCIIVAVPSLDTSVCNMEARRFDREAGALGQEGDILVISEDLPFAQKRWAEDAGVSRIRIVSDHRKAEFGVAYGILIKELRLLARTVFVVDKQGKVRYMELVTEQAREPDYDKAIAAAKGLL